MISFENFLELLKSKMNFLQNEYEFCNFQIERGGSYILAKTKNNYSGVKISLEPREGGVFTYICKLTKNNSFPKYEKSVNQTTMLSGFYIEDLMKVSDPINLQRLIEADKKNPEETDCQKILEIQSTYLKNVGSKILKGDFDLFKDAEKIVKERAKKNRLEKD